MLLWQGQGHLRQQYLVGTWYLEPRTDWYDTYSELRAYHGFLRYRTRIRPKEQRPESNQSHVLKKCTNSFNFFAMLSTHAKVRTTAAGAGALAMKQAGSAHRIRAPNSWWHVPSCRSVKLYITKQHTNFKTHIWKAARAWAVRRVFRPKRRVEGSKRSGPPPLVFAFPAHPLGVGAPTPPRRLGGPVRWTRAPSELNGLICCGSFASFKSARRAKLREQSLQPPDDKESYILELCRSTQTTDQRTPVEVYRRMVMITSSRCG